MRKFFKAILLIGLITLITVGCSNNSSSESQKKVRIVTSTNIYANIAKDIVGKYGKVNAIISNSNTDPHDFEPTVESAKEVSNSNIIIANGLGYDDWMSKLADSNNKKEVKVGEDLLHLKSNANPHIWYDLEMPEKYVNYLVKRASKLDPKHAQYFKKNGETYLKKIEQVKKIANGINGKNKKPVFVSEPVFDYALSDSGFTIGNKDFEDAIENETDPSATSVHTMENKISHRKISFFVNNTQASSSTVKRFVKLCRQHDIPVLDVRETMPSGINYFDWLLDNYKKLEEVAK